ncbi:outer membrane beta-barrel protein [Hymenobacter negativus]|uniref:Outer membrane beta-barrel protein n=1 Tax=Hymenobacter negativus TaxID=2795026 RepID=A0ABS0Q2D0_9BACT|nr:outer membrane beta-barrel protein [Hymenobacter negativus]MBH8556464.1 outer membrane beta-barrel protein [Hymenobacter negativus]
MRFLTFALGGLLCTAALPALAQTTTVADAPTARRFYIGLGAYHSNYQNLGDLRYGDTGFRVPVQLTAGYQLRPRLALELGAAYCGRTSRYAYDGYFYDGSGAAVYYQYSNTYTVRTTSVSALARYTLTRQPAHRLQFDVLGGVGLVHAARYSRGTQIDRFSGSTQSAPFAVRNATNNWLLTAGLAARYRLSSRFELNFDITTNRDLTRPDFIGSAALGLRYRFGQ